MRGGAGPSRRTGTQDAAGAGRGGPGRGNASAGVVSRHLPRCAVRAGAGPRERRDPDLVGTGARRWRDRTGFAPGGLPHAEAEAPRSRSGATPDRGARSLRASVRSARRQARRGNHLAALFRRERAEPGNRRLHRPRHHRALGGRARRLLRWREPAPCAAEHRRRDQPLQPHHAAVQEPHLPRRRGHSRAPRKRACPGLAALVARGDRPAARNRPRAVRARPGAEDVDPRRATPRIRKAAGRVPAVACLSRLCRRAGPRADGVRLFPSAGQSGAASRPAPLPAIRDRSAARLRRGKGPGGRATPRHLPGPRHRQRKSRQRHLGISGSVRHGRLHRSATRRLFEGRPELGAPADRPGSAPRRAVSILHPPGQERAPPCRGAADRSRRRPVPAVLDPRRTIRQGRRVRPVSRRRPARHPRAGKPQARRDRRRGGPGHGPRRGAVRSARSRRALLAGPLFRARRERSLPARIGVRARFAHHGEHPRHADPGGFLPRPGHRHQARGGAHRFG